MMVRSLRTMAYTDPDDLRTRTIGIPVTPGEREAIREWAKKQGLSVSEAARRVVLRQVELDKAMERTLREAGM